MKQSRTMDYAVSLTAVSLEGKVGKSFEEGQAQIFFLFFLIQIFYFIILLLES
jgi:hypothetical protein